MLNTRQKVLRDFWYSTVPIDSETGKSYGVNLRTRKMIPARPMASAGNRYGDMPRRIGRSRRLSPISSDLLNMFIFPAPIRRPRQARIADANPSRGPVYPGQMPDSRASAARSRVTADRSRSCAVTSLAFDKSSRVLDVTPSTRITRRRPVRSSARGSGRSPGTLARSRRRLPGRCCR